MSIFFYNIVLKLNSPQQMVSSEMSLDTLISLPADFIADRKFALRNLSNTVFEGIRVQVINQLVMYMIPTAHSTHTNPELHFFFTDACHFVLYP